MSDSSFDGSLTVDSKKPSSNVVPAESSILSTRNGFENISEFLQLKGYSVNTVSIKTELLQSTEINKWLEDVEKAILNLFDRLTSAQDKLIAASGSINSVENKNDSLYKKIEDLQLQLESSKRKEAQLQLKLGDYESKYGKLGKGTTTVGGGKASNDSSFSSIEKEGGTISSSIYSSSHHQQQQQQDRQNATKLKSMELLLKESERKLRQKEQEFDRLREKLDAYVKKERENHLKTRKTFTELTSPPSAAEKGGSKQKSSNKYSQSHSHSHSFSSSPSSASSSITPQKMITGNHLSMMNNKDQFTYQIFEGVEKSRQELLEKNYELELQLQHLSSSLKEQINLNHSIIHDNKDGNSDNDDSEDEGTGDEREDEGKGGNERKGKSSMISITKAGKKSSLPKKENSNSDKKQIKLIHDLEEQLISQKLEIEHFQRINNKLNKEKETLIETLKYYEKDLIKDLKTEIENLNIQLSQRPTEKQWNTAQHDIHELEMKIKELSQLKHEMNEMNIWRSYLSNKEKISIDKKNHELRLYMIDSLPLAILKDCVQTVCRELDLSDISEIPLSIKKLKTVIKTVPRMEELLSNLSSFIYDRDEILNQEILRNNSKAVNPLQKGKNNERESLDTLLPILRRWWLIIRRCLDLENFKASVYYELFRGNELKHAKDNNKKNNSTIAQEEEIIELHWEEYGFKEWMMQRETTILNRIREVIDFEQEVLSNPTNLQNVNKHLITRQDIIINRMLNHIQSLFDIQSVDDILPQLNEIYLQYRDFNQFLTLIRRIMGKDKSIPNATIMGEMVQLVSKTFNSSNTNSDSFISNATRIDF